MPLYLSFATAKVKIEMLSYFFFLFPWLNEQCQYESKRLLNVVSGVGGLVSWVVSEACVHGFVDSIDHILEWVAQVKWVYINFCHGSGVSNKTAWVEILVQFNKPVSVLMSCYFIIRHFVFYRILFDCSNEIEQALQVFFGIIYLVLLLPKQK